MGGLEWECAQVGHHPEDDGTCIQRSFMSATLVVRVFSIRYAQEIRQYLLVPVSEATLIECARVEVIFEVGQLERCEAFGRKAFCQESTELLYKNTSQRSSLDVDIPLLHSKQLIWTDQEMTQLRHHQ
jgi:hypothetical protein